MSEQKVIVMEKNEELEIEEVTQRLGEKCQFCGYRIRGLNHINGSHHKNKVAKG